MDNERKEFVKRMFRECKEKGIHTTSDIISFLVSLMQLNPAYQMKEDKEIYYAKISDALIRRLEDQTRPSLVALKNQLYFAKHYEERDEIVKKHRLRIHQKTGALVSDICETVKLETEKDSEKLYQKILVVITLLSGLGNPTTPAVLREVSIALQSIFPPSELNHYLTLSKTLKEEQLMEMMCIVAGIRIFNRDCQRGGEGIDDLPNILQEAIKRTHDSILELLEILMAKIYRFTALVEVILSLDLPEDDEDTCCGDRQPLPDSLTEEKIEWSIEMLTASRQQEIYVRKLLADVERCEEEIKNLMQRLQGRLFKLHDTVRYRTAIPTVQVYPQFIDLADIWMGLQDEVIVLSSISNFLWELQSLSTKNVNVYDHCLLKDMVPDENILTDAERLERSMGKLIEECGDCTLYYPNVTKDFEKINLEFLGFCAWTFVRGKGALIPGNPNNGVAKWRGKFYAFCSTEAAKNFGRDPDRYVYKALDFVRSHLEYVHLFQLYDEIESMRSREELTDEGPQLKICHNQDVQTDVHILPPIKDKNYASNIWEIRRRALQLARLTQCATRSTQTHKSHFRYGAYVQAAPPRDKAVQTRRDNYTNTKKLLTYIFGLRGRYDDCQHVLSFIEDELEHL